MNIYVFHIYLVMLVYFFIPKWNIGLLQNILILISPFIIIFILSRKKINKVYDGLFYPVNISIDTGKKSIKKYKKINKLINLFNELLFIKKYLQVDTLILY